MLYMKTLFDAFAQKLEENKTYQLNDAGRQLLQKFHGLVGQIEKGLVPILQPYVTNVDTLKKQIALQIISSINSQQLNNQEYEVMTRLDTLTNGGTKAIDPNLFTFNDNDFILKYLEIVEP